MSLPARFTMAVVAATAFTIPPVGDAGVAAAQAFPSRPIRLIVPWPPGGISDTSARILAQHMSASMGQPVVVENRAGWRAARAHRAHRRRSGKGGATG